MRNDLFIRSMRQNAFNKIVKAAATSKWNGIKIQEDFFLSCKTCEMNAKGEQRGVTSEVQLPP